MFKSAVLLSLYMRRTEDTVLPDLKAHHIENFYRHKLRVEKVSPNTVRRYHANIRKALQRSVQSERILTNPVDKVILPKEKKFRGNYYTPDELKVLIDCAKGTRFEIVIMLAVIWVSALVKHVVCAGRMLISKNRLFLSEVRSRTGESMVSSIMVT